MRKHFCKDLPSSLISMVKLYVPKFKYNRNLRLFETFFKSSTKISLARTKVLRPYQGPYQGNLEFILVFQYPQRKCHLVFSDTLEIRILILICVLSFDIFLPLKFFNV